MYFDHLITMCVYICFLVLIPLVHHDLQRGLIQCWLVLSFFIAGGQEYFEYFVSHTRIK